ncbi:MAG: hypothetical protein M1821_005941 [Bathelium mastoideum]|nr:MAG: hypothetical protein M1821_005941 [Bathelium mastoideum]
MPVGGAQGDGRIQPARLAFLSIYNPELGPTDETFRNQAVFYYTRGAQRRRPAETRPADEDATFQEEENEQLRQIGLAQGMVNFARGFSENDSVDSIETEKSRIVLYELEKGWWILASIDLTRIPTNPTNHLSSGTTEQAIGKPAIEYSSREVAPPSLLIQDLIRAHSIFCLHHGPSLSSLYVKISRQQFCNTLDRFWTQFARDWDVLLHGNPAVAAFGGLKLAAGGELGFGVGEEEWGSGEREVLEDLVGRTDGLVDVLVSRFGEPSRSPDTSPPSSKKPQLLPTTWIGCGHDPEAPDGVIFGGVGNLTRASLRNVSQWMATIYRDGEYAYGVSQNPHSNRKRRRHNPANSANGTARIIRNRDPEAGSRVEDLPARGASSLSRSPENRQATHSGIPPPIVSAAETALNNATSSADAHRKDEANKERTGTVRKRPALLSSGSWMRVLTLGYVGTPTSVKTQGPEERPEVAENDEAVDPSEAPLAQLEPTPDGAGEEHERLVQRQHESSGYYLIGLRGDLNSLQSDLDDEDEADSIGSRLLLRTLYIELTGRTFNTIEVDKTLSRDTSDVRNTETFTESWASAEDGFKRLRVVVYAHRPFIYAFLFDPRTDSLAIPSFYRSLATHLKPLHKPLCRNTAPTTIESRIESAQQSVAKTTSPSTNPSNHRIFDLIYDPATLTVHTSLPNVPDPACAPSATAAGLPPSWTRVEALNVHTQVLSLLAATRRQPRECERTCKTSRGWWVVWMRLPPSPSSSSFSPPSSSSSMATLRLRGENAEVNPQGHEGRQAILVRKASDGQAGAGARVSAGGWGASAGVFGLRAPSWGGMGSGGGGGGWPGRLAEGIGIDARRYVEGLLSLNR